MNIVAALIAPLFVPANRPDRFAKAAASGADAVIVDLEDAVPADAKEQARANLHGLTLDKPVIVRINGAGTPWHEGDCEVVRGLGIAALMLPKAELVGDLARLQAIAPVIAMVESAAGLAEARAMARSGFAARLAFGSVDYAADLGCDHTRKVLYAARSELVFASRLGGLPAPIDGVTTDLVSAATVQENARAARAQGFGGKLLVHPSQVRPVLDAFQPSADEIDWARRIAASGDGAVGVDGMMVDEPVRIRARAILARAAAPPSQ